MTLESLQQDLIRAQVELTNAEAAYWRALSAQVQGATYNGYVPGTAI